MVFEKGYFFYKNMVYKCQNLKSIYIFFIWGSDTLNISDIQIINSPRGLLWKVA